MKQRRLSSFAAGLAGLLLLAVAGWGLLNYQFISDWIRAEQYQPSAAVSGLVDTVGMTDRGKMLFYASSPRLESANSLNESCKSIEKNSAVLGCYVSRQIFIYNVDHPELAGIQEVTAAHEMLHAVYDRLSSSERREVNNLLNQAAASLRADQRFTERLEAYDFEDSDERFNELHSIIGTEVDNLDPKLEAHYAKYFANRSAVVSLHNQYRDVFDNYSEQAEQLAGQLDNLAVEINNLSNAYRRAADQLSSDVARFNERADDGGFRTQAEFDSARNDLVRRQDQLDADYRTIDGLRNRYDQFLDEYNGIAQHLAELNNSIDSRVSPAVGVD